MKWHIVALFILLSMVTIFGLYLSFTANIVSLSPLGISSTYGRPQDPNPGPWPGCQAIVDQGGMGPYQNGEQCFFQCWNAENGCEECCGGSNTYCWSEICAGTFYDCAQNCPDY